MRQMRIVVDLPGDALLKALRREPYPGYDSAKLRDLLESRLKSEFPGIAQIKVEVIPNNLFFGADVMGDDLEEMAKCQGRLAEIIAATAKDLKR